MTAENVTVLFTDMVGSTALASSLAQDAADELRVEHFSILRQAIAESGGTEVKNLGDGLMVVFSAASAALSCAVAMQQGVERDNRDREQAVGLRIGLSVGEVSKEEGPDYFGDPVIEAARLCAACESGQILATDMVRGMAGRRSRHECRSLGEVTLRGLPEPVEFVEVLWEPIDGTQSDTSIPLPPRLAFRPAVGVLGRSTDLAAIVDAFKRVASGGGREVLLVSGEAGLGKTTLVAEAARVLFDAGGCVLFGHCEEDLATPYQLFAEALGHFVTHAPEEQLVAHVAAHGSELARLVPTLASRLADLPPSKATDSDTERYLLFAAVVGLLAQVSRDQPVVVVLDDLQWADKASLLLLRHLVAGEPTMRVLVLGTYRDSELSTAHALVETLAAMRRQHTLSRIELAGLDDHSVVAFLEAAAGYALDEAGVSLAHAVYRETDGNPFFVSEVLRHLSETGMIYRDAAGRWVADEAPDQLALPDSVREVIGARVLRLGPDAGRVLSTAAVVGRDFDLELLANATNASEEELLDILDAAATASLVRELADAPGHYSFAHALIQHTLYEDLSPTRRARAHRQVAEALEDLCGERPGTRIGELARHWFNATRPNDVSKAISYARQAGDAALAGLAPADALRYYAEALDLYPQATEPDPVLGLDLAIGIGTAQRQTGDPAFRVTLLDAARKAVDLGDTTRLVAAALANDRGVLSAAGRIDTEKVTVLETTVERLAADAPGRALALATLCSELSNGTPLERRLALAEEALPLAIASGDDAIVVRVLNNLFSALFVPPMLEQSLARTADALVRAERVGDPWLLFVAHLWRSLAVLHTGDVDEFDRSVDRARELSERIDQPFGDWAIALCRALRALVAGNTDRAEELVTEALRVGNDGGQPDAAVMFGAQLGVVHLQRGTMGDFAPLIEQIVGETPDTAAAMKAALAVAYVEGNRIDDARQILDEFAATDFDVPLDHVWTSAMVNFAEVAIAVGDAGYAAPLFDRLAPYADQFSTASVAAPEGPVRYYLGGLATLLGRYDDADAYFAKAAAMSTRMGAEFIAARTDLMWGTMLAERDDPGDTERALDLLTRARTVATANGYANVQRRATQALQRLP
ncbi:MAG: ATP-binding protein [Acidimicrobiia bacterium]